MVPEAPLEQTEHGLVAAGDGWFVLNAHEARWWDRASRGKEMGIHGKADFAQIGIGLYVLGPGEPMAMYHWETDQEGSRSRAHAVRRRLASWSLAGLSRGDADGRGLAM